LKWAANIKHIIAKAEQRLYFLGQLKKILDQTSTPCSVLLRYHLAHHYIINHSLV